MKMISMIANDHAFKATSAISCFGLVLSFGMMAFGMDPAIGGI